MRDEKEGRKKQARSNKQQGKATQHTHIVCTCTIILQGMYMHNKLAVAHVWVNVFSAAASNTPIEKPSLLLHRENNNLSQSSQFSAAEGSLTEGVTHTLAHT